MAGRINLPTASLEADTLIPIPKSERDRRRDRQNSSIWKRTINPGALQFNPNEVIGLEDTLMTIRRAVCDPLNNCKRNTVNGKAFLLVGIGKAKDYLVNQLQSQIDGLVIEMSIYSLPELDDSEAYGSFILSSIAK